jgi:uncharacterized protein GlcG (DUF336 family)
VTLTSDQAEAAIDGTLAKGAAYRIQSLTIAMLGAGRHMVAFRHQYSGGILRPETSIGKTNGELCF